MKAISKRTLFECPRVVVVMVRVSEEPLLGVQTVLGVPKVCFLGRTFVVEGVL